MQKHFLAICFIWLSTSFLWATELPPPFTSYETASSSGGGTFTWDINQDEISGDIYAGWITVSSMYSILNLKFNGTLGTLRFRCVIYAGDMYSNDQKWSCDWLSDGVLIDKWDGSLNGASYREVSIACRFEESGEHVLGLCLAMTKQSSKHYVQGPQMKISNIEWQPDYVDVDVDGKSVRVDGEWVRQNVSSNVLHDCKYDYCNILNRVGDNGYTILDSYIAGLTPTNSNSRLLADIHMVNNAAVITWEPNLDTRVYTVYGKTNLTDRAWHSPTNEASRFFKVGVEMR